jgi:uncharacterized repeat protein (TIGR03803 family)
MKAKLLLVFLFLPMFAVSQTYTFSTLVSFPAVSKNGPSSPSTLIIDSAGNLYGVSNKGGAHGLGTVFKVTPAGLLSTLYSFGSVSNDGLAPFGTLARDSAGNLYGTASTGGTLDPACLTTGCGTVFKLTAGTNGTFTFSVLFSGPQEDSPQGVTLDSARNVYGISAFGGTNNGSIFEITTGGVFTDLYDFCEFDGEDGCHPAGNPIFDKTGTLYGVTSAGGFFHGANDAEDGGYGVVFSWSPTLGFQGATHTFTDGECETPSACDVNPPTGFPDGALPLAKLTQNTAGDKFGTTFAGGLGAAFGQFDSGFGTVYKIAANGAYSILYSFCHQTNCTDGFGPAGAIVLDSSGNVFGTSKGGAQNHGAVFKITSTGTESVIYSATGSAGVGSALVMDKAGNLYGTTAGGSAHTGSIFKLTKH